MKVQSSRFGEVNIDEHSIIEFPEGIPGFEELKKYVIMRCEQTEPIQWMQSIENQYIAMPVINPFILDENYHVEVNDEELNMIGTFNEEDMVVLCIMVLPEELKDMTANFMAPVLINVNKMKGCQVVMDSGDMPIKFPAYGPLLEYYRRECGSDAGVDEKSK